MVRLLVDGPAVGFVPPAPPVVNDRASNISATAPRADGVPSQIPNTMCAAALIPAHMPVPGASAVVVQHAARDTAQFIRRQFTAGRTVAAPPSTAGTVRRSRREAARSWAEDRAMASRFNRASRLT
jgi:hypothetical protein